MLGETKIVNADPHASAVQSFDEFLSTQVAAVGIDQQSVEMIAMPVLRPSLCR